MFFSRRKLLKLGVQTACVGAVMNAPLGAQTVAELAGAAPLLKLAMIEGLSGVFANTGESVYRNLLWAVERINARPPEPTRRPVPKLDLRRYDNKGQVEEALSALRSAIDEGAHVILHGNSSAVAAALIDAIAKHNEREPKRRVIYLNYSAVDPVLTNEKCSPWHFRFDAHADMRMTALMSVLKDDRQIRSAYLIGQDYSFGQAVVREGRRQLGVHRPDVRIVGDELHPLGRVKDFAPYAIKIKTSGADAVITGNWGNDLTLLIRAAKEVGFEGKFYTFYGNALGAPAAIGEAGIGRVIAVADWLPNVQTAQSQAFYRAFKTRFPSPVDDYVHMRMALMMEALAQASAAAAQLASTIDTAAIRERLSTATVHFAGQTGYMRASDGQFQQPLVVGVMQRVGSPGVANDVEGSGYGFRVIASLTPAQAQLAHSCRMPAA